MNLATAYDQFAQIGNLTLNAGATLSVTRSGSSNPNAAYSVTAGPLAVAGNAVVNVANNGNGPGTLAVGTLSGSGNLTDERPGALVLTGTDGGFTGQTLISGGTFQVAPAAPRERWAPPPGGSRTTPRWSSTAAMRPWRFPRPSAATAAWSIAAAAR